MDGVIYRAELLRDRLDFERTDRLDRPGLVFRLRAVDDPTEEADLLREPGAFKAARPFLPPPVCLFTVAQARRSASFLEVPRFS